jgi:hypothetical protein
VSQQEFSYFGPEQETVYEPRPISRDPRESRGEQEQTVYYVTPEQSMLRGEKLVPTRRTKSYANWVAAAIFVLMMLFGGLIWGHQVRSEYYVNPPCPVTSGFEQRCEKQPSAPNGERQFHHHDKENQFSHPEQNSDD